MRIAVAQMNTQAGDFEFTAQTMLEYAQRAQQQGAELVIYPPFDQVYLIIQNVSRETFHN